MLRKSLLFLPSKYAEQVVEAEMNLEKTRSLENFKILISLYIVKLIQKGIEFYEANQDEKYVYYKAKMDKLLTNKKEILRRNRFESPEFQALNALKLYEQKSNTLTKDIQSNLSAQNFSLNDRINVRRKSMRSRTFSPSNLPNLGVFKDIQGKVEEIIEKLVMEKILRIKEVKKKCKLSMMNGNVIVIAEEMNSQVERIEEEFEITKKQMIFKVLTQDSN